MNLLRDCKLIQSGFLLRFFVFQFIILFFSACATDLPYGPLSKVSFDSEKWKSQKMARYDMAKDVVFSVIRPGTSTKEVLDKLGPPDKKISAQLSMEYWCYDLPFKGNSKSKPQLNVLIGGGLVSSTEVDLVGEGAEPSENSGVL